MPLYRTYIIGRADHFWGVEDIDCADDQEDLTVTHMLQNLFVRQRFRYFGMIAIFLIVTVALCWGFTHI